MRDPAWLASHTQYGGVQNDPPKIRIGMQVLNISTKLEVSTFAFLAICEIFAVKGAQVAQW